QLGPQLPIVQRGFDSKSKNFKTRSEVFYGDKVLRFVLGFFGTVVKLSECNAGDAESMCEFVKAFAREDRRFLHDVDASVRIQHMRQHQKSSHFEACGCKRSGSMSLLNRGPCSNQSSQDRPAGVTNLAAPTFRISTEWTSFGNAIALGSRTA